MATTTVFTQYRPIRIAFLVKEGDIDGLVKAAGINTLLWGGIYNPIIPISGTNKDDANKLLRFFNVDVLYKVSSTPEIDDIYNENRNLRDPSYMGNDIFYEDWISKRNNIAYLDLHSIVAFYWEKELKHADRKYKSNCLLVDWKKTERFSSLFSLMFGFFPDSYNLKLNYRKAFEKGLRSNTYKFDVSTDLQKDLIESITPIETTGLELNGSRGNLNGDGIYIGDEENFRDLTNYWNLRASGINVKFFPNRNYSRFKNYIQTYLTKLDKSTKGNSQFKESIYVYYQGDSKRISSILKCFNLKNKDFCFSYCDTDLWNGLNIKPIHFCFKYQRSLANIEKNNDSYTLSFSLPEKKFLTEDFDTQQSLVVEVSSLSDFAYPNHTLKLPFLPQLNEFYSREVCLEPDNLRINHEGISLIIKSDETNLQIRPIKHEMIVKEIFKLAGYKAETNQAGLLTKQIISKMREEQPLEACRVFKITGIRNLIKLIKARDFISWDEGIKKIGRERFDKFKSLYIEPRDTLKLSPQNAFNFLIKKNIFRPELKSLYRFITPMKNFRCRSCGLNKRVKISEYLNQLTCEYCGNVNNMRNYISEDFNHKEINKYFTFHKSGLFAKDNNQEGAIPVILTLLTLKRILHHGDIVYSTAMNINGDIKCEIDFSVLNIEYDKIEIGIAECKSKGCKDDSHPDIDTDDINKLTHIQDNLKKLGVDCYIIISKTEDSFKPSEINLFKKLNEENRRFVLLTNNELEPYEPYWELEETENLPQKYPQGLEDMYYNSQYLYLREDGNSLES